MHSCRWGFRFSPSSSFITRSDRYKDRTEEGTVTEYLAFILFFPTMVAGPIKRYQDFLPKLRSISREWVIDWQRGVTRILAGLVKKFAVADVLTAYTNHLNSADISRADRPILPLWIFAYGIKIYADFSAYSDIAIGSARLFGIRVPENFDWPYLRTNITEFWRHWHMSLTNWLIDYIYIPLGGSRRGERPGLREHPGDHAGERHLARRGSEFHRVGAAARRDAGRCGARGGRCALWRRARAARGWSQLGSWLLTYVCVNLAWAFFCMDVHTALFFFRRLLDRIRR